MGDRVKAKRLIAQSPLSESPDIPVGAIGFIQDAADGYLFVDFDEPYGVICCDSSELEICMATL